MKSKLAMSLCLATGLLAGCPKGPPVTVWEVNQLDAIGGMRPEILGAPRVMERDGRKALCFDGKADGMFLPGNPIEGMHAFTIQIQFFPDGDGPAEQRFLHIQDLEERRVLIETRVNAPEKKWALDTFLRATDADKLTLLDLGKSQPTDKWYWAALVYDGKSMRHFVDGNKQLEGSVAFPPTGPGRISLGVRQNRVHWFKGCIAQVRFTPVALDSRDLQRR